MLINSCIARVFILVSDNENDLYCKFSWFVSCHSHSHGNKNLIKKKFFVHKFSLPPNTTCSNGNVLE